MLDECPLVRRFKTAAAAIGAVLRETSTSWLIGNYRAGIELAKLQRQNVRKRAQACVDVR